MQSFDRDRRGLADEEFRAAMRAVAQRSGRSLRSLSLAIGRDPGYLAALLDPSRPSRARPTPDDLLALSDATSIPFVELLTTLWAVPRARLVAEIERLPPNGDDGGVAELAARDRRLLAEFAEFLAWRHRPDAPVGGSGGV